MKIITTPEFFQTLKGSFILLDTNIFIDAFHNPSEFGQFFKQLKENQINIVTIDAVQIEFTKGSSDITKLEEKNKLISQIADAILPVDKAVTDNVTKLLKLYKIEAKDISIVDLFLGGMLVKYAGKMFLMTKDIKDFPTNIFDLKTHLSVVKRRSIQNYGIYFYK